MSDRVDLSDQEINAYLDGELNPERRLEVQALIARDGDLARRVMTDMHLTDAMKLAQKRPVHSPETIGRARRLHKALSRRRWFPNASRGLIAASLLLTGWFANSLSVPYRQAIRTADEAFALSIRDTIQVAELDEMVRTTFEPVDEKLQRLGAAVAVDVPELPRGWYVRQVRLQRIDGRRSVIVNAVSAEGAVSLVASPMNRKTSVPPTAVTDPTTPAVFWQQGATGYTLVGKNVRQDVLESVATSLTVASRRGLVPKIRG
ncbi:hypothetical protein [Chthonobacter rhizosphaerae]|uniref:hypothetical protein n=1 Tax=Chthonobacter rhizosphaerae TaxID=2735553 RepID=UPI0015EF1B69|nr:hypothetical protein [Chthonobacter rhizosphaerae]